MRKEKKNKSWKGMLLIVLMLAIGFAAVTTTLVINGTINFGANAENFEKNLKFTDAKLEYSDTTKTAVTTGLIAEDGKSITFTTDTLTMIDETATLTYEISNLSQYDADLAEIACTVTKNGTDVTPAVVTNKTGEYIKLEASSVKGVLAKAAVKPDNTVKVTMIKSYAGEPDTTNDAGETVKGANTASYEVRCEIVANGLSTPGTTSSTTTTVAP